VLCVASSIRQKKLKPFDTVPVSFCLHFQFTLIQYCIHNIKYGDVRTHNNSYRLSGVSYNLLINLLSLVACIYDNFLETRIRISARMNCTIMSCQEVSNLLTFCMLNKIEYLYIRQITNV